jgi:hypothetical protein
MLSSWGTDESASNSSRTVSAIEKSADGNGKKQEGKEEKRA